MAFKREQEKRVGRKYCKPWNFHSSVKHNFLKKHGNVKSNIIH
jgi:hypothetical protein